MIRVDVRDAKGDLIEAIECDLDMAFRKDGKMREPLATIIFQALQKEGNSVIIGSKFKV